MGQLRLALIGGAALAALSFGAGWKVHDWRDAAAEVHQVKAVVATVQKQAAVNQAIAVHQQAAQDQIHVVYRTIHDQVPHYITVKADAGCVVPDGFVRLHDAAVAGVPPSAEPPGISPDAPSGIALSTVADTVAGNYGQCYANAVRLRGWQDWWAGVSVAK